jgi:hypothetical protein
MLFNGSVLFIAPLIKPVENVQALKDVVKQQGNKIVALNNALNCARPDKFKVSWDARQAEIAAGADPKSLPPLKQI